MQVKVQVLYEPPQENSVSGFTILEDPRAEKVEHLAAALGLKRVGWIFAHPTREEVRDDCHTLQCRHICEWGCLGLGLQEGRVM
jgi:nuclear protein localization protein 4 homolog